MFRAGHERIGKTSVNMPRAAFLRILEGLATQWQDRNVMFGIRKHNFPKSEEAVKTSR